MDRHHNFRLGFTIVLYITYCGRSMVVNGLSAYQKIGGKIPDELVFYQGVQGEPGVDFPVFSRIPKTSFNCREVESGYYADLETDCQVFHICNDGAKISFLCPNGTIFQQSDLICEWWFKVKCSESPNYYQESAEQLREDTKKRKSLRKVINNIKYNVINKSQSKIITNEPRQQIINSIVLPERKNETSARFTSDISRIEQLNGNRGQRKFNFNPPRDVSNSLSVGPTQPTHTSSEETQVPEESASFYKNSQNTIQQVGKQVTTNPYPNHRETYSAEPDIKYFYTQPLSGFPQSTSPASPQTRSTNRFPLNDGKPFVVTTPRVQYNINSFQSASEIPISSTEQFRYSPTVPPITVTSKSLLQPTSLPKVEIDSKLASPVYASEEDQLDSKLGVDINPNSESSFSKDQLGGKLGVDIKPNVEYSLSKDQLGSKLGVNINPNIESSLSNDQLGGKLAFDINPNSESSLSKGQVEGKLGVNIISNTESSFSKDQLGGKLGVDINPNSGSSFSKDQLGGKLGVDIKPNVEYSLSKDQLGSKLGVNINPNIESSLSNDQLGGKLAFDINPNSESSLSKGQVEGKLGVNINSNTESSFSKDQLGGKLVVDIRPNSESSLTKAQLSGKLGVDVNPNSEPSFSKIPQSVLDSINDDHQTQVSSSPSTLGTQQFSSGISASTRNFDAVGSTGLPNLDEKYVTSSSIIENNAHLLVNPLIHLSDVDNKNLNQETVNTTSLPDHQIVIGHPTLYFDDVNPSVTGSNKYDKKRPDALRIPDYQIIIGHPKTNSSPNTTVVFGKNRFGEIPGAESERTLPGSKVIQTKIDTSTLPFENKKHSLSYASPSYNTISDFTQNNRDVAFKPFEITTASPTTESPIIKIKISNESNEENRSTTLPEPKILLKESELGVPVTDSDIFRVSINGQINTEQTTSIKTTRRNGFYVTKDFVYNVESTAFPSSASSSGNTYLPKSTTALPSFSKDITSVDRIPTVLNKETSAGVAQPPDTVLKDEVLRPKPFELPPKTNFVEVDHVVTTESPSSVDFTIEPYPHVYVSSARPFSANTLESALPTFPTEFTTEKPSIYEHVHNMIITLKEIADEEKRKGGDANTSRTGLVIPPSVGPQSLHSLAVYFANALDSVTTTEGREQDSGDDETEAQAINELLTRATLNRYHELFKNINEDEDEDGDNEDDEITTDFSVSKSEDVDTSDNDLVGQHSKNPTVTPRVRQLAQVFTKALSSYLDDPDTFKKALQEIRPTEPPQLANTGSRIEDDELLNYSDADIVPGLPRLTTTTSISPTWGYILAPNNSNSFEYNSLSSEGENLQSADSQSFVTQFNNLVKDKLQKQKEAGTSPKLEVYDQTTSSGVTNLWRDSLYTHPLTINRNLGTEEIETETPKPSVSSIDYELRSLPKLSLNSTQVHGLLIDFMNSSTPDDTNKLHRILEKLNTTQDEFLEKMRAIEQNPITRRLILLLISECGSDVTKDAETKTTTVHEVLSLANVSDAKITPVIDKSVPSPFQIFVDPSLHQEDDDTRALQLLNALYSISSKFGK